MSIEENSGGSCLDVSKYKYERAEEDLTAALTVMEKDLWKAANNRAYYAVYHAIDAVLALEPIGFKRYKDTIAYFNQHYVHEGKFPLDLGHRIARLEEIRHKSDYDDFYIASREEAQKQIDTAVDVLKEVKRYLEENAG